MNMTEQTKPINPSPPAQSSARTTSGIVLTLLITIGFCWAIFQLFNLSTKEPPLTLAEVKQNEIQAYKNLNTIVQAQEKYIREDRNRDGKKEYAMFYYHLWTTVSPRSEPILLNYISKELAFAMDGTMNPRGYYYNNLYQRYDGAKKALDNDYSRQWSVIAQPSYKGRTGEITFIVDQSQRIYALPEMYTIPVYPYEPDKHNWTLIDSVEAMETYQQNLKNHLKRMKQKGGLQ